MKVNRIFLVSLILLGIISLGAVSASDNITDDALSADDSLSESLNEEIPTDELVQSNVDDEVLSANDSQMKVNFVTQDDNGTISAIDPNTDIYVNDHDSDYFRVKFPQLVTGTLSLYIDGKFMADKEITAKTHYLFVNTKSYNLTEGTHMWKMEYSGDDEYNPCSLNGTFVLNPANGNFTLKNPNMNVYVVTQDIDNVTYAIDENKDLSVKNTKTDYFKVKFPKQVTGKLYLYIDGKLKSTKKITAKTHYFFANAESYKLKAGKHTWEVRYSGNNEYNAASVNGTFTLTINTQRANINKTSPSMTAPKKTYKPSIKTKKYTVTLKANKKAVKKAKVYLTINGKNYKKTFTATTNNKGQATFKITKLTKKGTYDGTIKYKGSKNNRAINTTLTIKITKKKCTITKKASKTEPNPIVEVPTVKIADFIDVSDAYKYLNEFRLEKGVWQWDENDVTKTVFNEPGHVYLKELDIDAELEDAAKQRALDNYQIYNRTKSIFDISHYRPDGSVCFTIYPLYKLYNYGENIAAGQNSAESVMESWKETNYKYAGQGHRQNMLSPDFDCVGIAAYKAEDGTIFWVQAFGLLR